MTMRRYYIDTSVFGGCFEDEWIEASRRLLDLVRHGRVRIVTSAIVQAELDGAPDRVRRLVESLPATVFEVAAITDEVHRLQGAYLAAGVLGKRSEDDAAHVAVASIARVDAIVSWNFRDLVREDRIKGFNRVKLGSGIRPHHDRVPTRGAGPMTTKKAKGSIDCVAMKRALQARLAAETAGMTWDEKVAFYRKKAMTGPLAAFWREVEGKGAAGTPASSASAKPKHRRPGSPRRRSR